MNSPFSDTFVEYITPLSVSVILGFSCDSGKQVCAVIQIYRLFINFYTFFSMKMALSINFHKRVTQNGDSTLDPYIFLNF